MLEAKFDQARFEAEALGEPREDCSDGIEADPGRACGDLRLGPSKGQGCIGRGRR